MGRWCSRLWEAILCLLMVLHLASEQWVMIARKRLELRRDGEERKSDDDNDEEEYVLSLTARLLPRLFLLSFLMRTEWKKRKSKGR